MRNETRPRRERGSIHIDGPIRPGGARNNRPWGGNNNMVSPHEDTALGHRQQGVDQPVTTYSLQPKRLASENYSLLTVISTPSSPTVERKRPTATSGRGPESGSRIHAITNQPNREIEPSGPTVTPEWRATGQRVERAVLQANTVRSRETRTTPERKLP